MLTVTCQVIKGGPPAVGAGRRGGCWGGGAGGAGPWGPRRRPARCRLAAGGAGGLALHLAAAPVPPQEAPISTANCVQMLLLLLRAMRTSMVTSMVVAVDCSRHLNSWDDRIIDGPFKSVKSMGRMYSPGAAGSSLMCHHLVTLISLCDNKDGDLSRPRLGDLGPGHTVNGRPRHGAQVRKEVVLEGPRDKAAEALDIVRDCMRQPFSDHDLVVPDLDVALKLGDNLQDAA